MKKLKQLWAKLTTPKPFQSGYMDTGDGHQVYYAVFGNKKGEALLHFHGGPAGLFKDYHSKSYNLKKYKVIFFDQRGCGRSKPFAKLENNETKHVFKDAEQLLRTIGIKDNEKLTLSGGSWGSALVPVFAARHPKRIKQIILRDFFNGLEKIDKWIFEDSQQFYPEMYEEFSKDIPKGKNPFKYYHEQIHSTKLSDRKNAVRKFVSYERSLGDLNPKMLPKEFATENMIKHVQLVLHYQSNNYFLKPNEIEKCIPKIKHIPCIIIHNRLDMICPLEGAYNFANKYGKKCKLTIVDELGHGGPKLHKTFVKAMKKV